MLKEVALNLVSQILFFIVGIFFVPWVCHAAINKNGDFEKLAQKYEKSKDAEEKRILYKKMRLYGKFLNVIIFIHSWTMGLWRNLVSYVILTITLNSPKLIIRVGKGRMEEDLGCYIPKGRLYSDCVCLNPVYYWYRPIKMLGIYLNDFVFVLMGPCISAVLFSIMLPSTTASIIDGFAQWGFTNGSTVNAEFFVSIYNGFIDIAWSRFALGGFAENPILMIIFLVILSLFLSGNFIIIISKGIISEDLLCVPMVIVILAILNVIFAMMLPTYTCFAGYINSAGVAILYVILLTQIVCIITNCLQWTIQKIIDKLSPI